ncbi:2-methylcitrate dehydratase PrpD [Allocatelliglobosispora scoriae]|uniref:2-methylcitrate dehydratase PrpD n=1 Tax=Allocatelliglobosispora scoriae TaxID=643052 RepID=A0A841C0W7_9ACTN|nr:MmgE/PrpD family protein [Allocatelliglobosispora scoriae]MBB5873378.1 2-methylcitrate dehydratase PrpD [Allocatelliglobosispora scoriae]
MSSHDTAAAASAAVPDTAAAVGSAEPVGTAVQRLAAFAVGCRESLPAAVAADVPGRILDILGLALAASTEPGADAVPSVLRAVRRWGGIAESTVVGTGERLPAPVAALVNGTMAHALDFDDTHLPSVLHPSASVVPAALAAAEATGADGDALIAAVAAGIEICNRLGTAAYDAELRNSVFFERGLHATSICGTIGSAAAAGLLYGLDAAGIASAMGIAASMGAGLIEANRTGGTVKKVHCGWAAHGGVTAAVLAAEGMTGPPTVLEGRFGFFAAYTDGRFDAGALLDGLGTRWELLRTVYKPYPTNHFTHPGIDCALALRERGLTADDVASAELGVAAPVLRTIAEPAAEKARPASAYHAKFSGPYTVAAALTGGGGLGVTLSDFAELRADRLALAARIRCVADERATERFPTAFGAVLRVRTHGGELLEHRVDSSRGGPEHPLRSEELALKFAINATGALTDAAAQALTATVLGRRTATEIMQACIADR